MKSAAEYAEMAETILDPPTNERLLIGFVYATLAGAAATLEAARMRITAEASRLLDALTAPNPDALGVCPGCGCEANVDRGEDGPVCEEYPSCKAQIAKPTLSYCQREWTDDEAQIPRQHAGGHGVHTAPSLHRCAYTAGHEKEEPHYCHCGSEL
jgi:hypothetical protein